MRTIEAAAELGVTRQRVDQLIRQRKLRAWQPGPNLYLVERASVEAYRQTRRPPGRPKRDRT